MRSPTGFIFAGSWHRVDILRSVALGSANEASATLPRLAWETPRGYAKAPHFRRIRERVGRLRSRNVRLDETLTPIRNANTEEIMRKLLLTAATLAIIAGVPTIASAQENTIGGAATAATIAGVVAGLP